MPKEFLRYFVSSGLAFVVDYLTLYSAVQLLGWHYLVGAAMGFSLGIVCIYFLSTCWIFEARRCSDPRREFFIFIMIGLLGLLLNVIVMFLGTDIFGVHYLWTKLWSVAVVFFFNFGMRKYILFRK